MVVVTPASLSEIENDLSEVRSVSMHFMMLRDRCGPAKCSFTLDLKNKFNKMVINFVPSRYFSKTVTKFFTVSQL